MTDKKEELIQRLIKLWSDENFGGAFTGVQNFQSHLKLEADLDVSKRVIREALKRLPEFSTTITRRYKFRRRRYSVDHARQLAEIDYAFMKQSSRGYNGFICLIDGFTRMIFVEKIKSKLNSELKKKYKSLFKQSGPFNTVSGDGEIENMKKWFKEKNMYLHIKPKGRHANLVENAIRNIKRTLHYILRNKKNKDWAKYLPKAVDTVNHNYNPALGGLQPAICDQDLELGDTLISDALKKVGKRTSNLLNQDEQKKLKNEIEKDPSFSDYMPGKSVMLDMPSDRAFEKETSPKRARIFYVRAIDYRQKPVMFYLNTLDGKKVKG